MQKKYINQIIIKIPVKFKNLKSQLLLQKDLKMKTNELLNGKIH